MNISNPYTLPEINFIGGSTQEIDCSVYLPDGKKPFDLEGCSAYFSLIDCVNKHWRPIIYNEMKIEANESGILNVLRLQIKSAETIKLFGKYIYQISIHDSFGNIDNRQGIMLINNNINKNCM